MKRKFTKIYENFLKYWEFLNNNSEETLDPKFSSTRRVRKVNTHHVKADRENFYAYCGYTAVDLGPLPVSRARLTVVEPGLFE